MADNNTNTTPAWVAPHEMGSYAVSSEVEDAARKRYEQKKKQAQLSFNGVKYQTQEQADAARQKFMTLARADYMSVGGDMNLYNQQKQNKTGLRWMSDREWNYISKLHSQNASPTAYKKTAMDQYFQSVGLPSEKDLNKYRIKYAEYAALGGIQDRYKNLTEDELNFIKERWDEDTIRGLNGDRYMKNTKADGTSVDGKEVKTPDYKDTLLDTELYENDLPPAAQMEIYHAQYLEKKKAEDDWRNAYNTSVESLYKDADAHYKELRADPENSEKSDDALLKQAFLDMFIRPEYEGLYQYVTGDAVIPKMTDSKYLIKDEDDPNYGKFDEGSSYYDDVRKAKEKENVIEGNRSLTVDKFKTWRFQQEQDKRRQAFSKRYTEVRDAGIRAMTEPAYTPEAKAKQKEAYQNYNLYFGDGSSGDFREVQWYFDSLNAGVPADVCAGGIAEIDKWNKTENAKNPGEFAKVQLAIQGITPDNDKEYKTKLKAISATKAETTKKGYTRNSEFNQQLYDGSIIDERGTESVPVSAAIYAKINGQSTAKLSDANDSDLYSKIYLPFFNYEGTGIGLAAYMSEEEKKAFNSKYANSTENAMQYLDELYPLLVSRRERAGIDDFGQALKSGDMTETDYADYIYDYNIAQARSRIMQANPESDEAYTTEAWRKYSGYSDQQLDYILEEAKQKLTDAVDTADYELEYQEYQQLARDIDFVQDTRAEARQNANVAGSIKDFTPEEGAKATAQVQQQMGDPGNGRKSILDKDGNRSEFFAAVNGVILPSNADIEDDDYTWSERNDMDVASSMTQEEKDTFNWLFVNKGAKAADDYFRAMYNVFDARTAESIVAKNKEWAKKNPFNGILATVGSSLMYPVSGFSSLSGTISNGLSSLLGQETRLTRTQAAKWDFTNEWREGISEDWNFWGGFAYNTLMGMVDSGMAAGMNAVLPGFGEVALASNAFASTLRSGIDRGLDPNKATATALFAGFAEYITEKIGLEQLVNLVSGVGKTAGRTFLKDFLINTGKQALYEGSEELASELLNTFTDTLINGDMSEFNQEVQSYVAQGMSKDEALELAWGNWLKNAGLATLGGAISGGILAGGGTIGKRIVMGKNHPATVPHVNDYIKGSDIVSDRYGKDLSRNIQNALGTSETVDDQRRINGIISQLANVSKSSDLYSTIYDENGNVKLNREQQVALASALAYAGANADLDSMEAANTRIFAEQQSESERRANTDYDSIKTPQALSQAKNQLEVLKKGIADRRNAIATKLNEKRSAVQVAQADVASKQQMWENADLEGKKAAADALSAATDKLKTARDALSTFMSGDYADNETAIKQSQEQIKEIQHALDKHYASYNAYLNDTTANREEMQVNYDAAKARVDALGEELDFLQDGYIAPNSAAEAWFESVQDQMAEAQQEADIYRGWLNRSTPASLHDAIAAARNGNAAAYAKGIAEQRTESQNSAEQNTESSEQNAQQNAEQKTEEPKPVEQKRVVNIGKTAQNTIERTARRFGCEIVWSTRAELGANGYYDPKTPNRIYLAKDMLASKSMSTDTVVAREFFTHELVHYVRNTNTYGNLRDNALKYYEQQYKDDGGAQMIIDAIIEKERTEHNREFSQEQAKEELTAQFVQEALFAGMNTEQSLVWLAREDGNCISNLLKVVQNLITRGKVRNLSENNATRKLLEKSEHDLLKAIRERKRLDAAGLSHSFQDDAKAETKVAATEEAQDIANASEENAQQGEAPVEQTAETAPAEEAVVEAEESESPAAEPEAIVANEVAPEQEVEAVDEEVTPEVTEESEETPEVTQEVTEETPVAEETEASEPSPVEETVQEETPAPTEEVAETPAPVEETETAPQEEAVAEPVQETAEETAQPIQETPVQEAPVQERAKTAEEIAEEKARQREKWNKPAPILKGDKIETFFTFTNEGGANASDAHFGTPGGIAQSHYAIRSCSRMLHTAFDECLYDSDRYMIPARVGYYDSECDGYAYGKNDVSMTNKRGAYPVAQVNVTDSRNIRKGNSLIENVINFPFLSVRETYNRNNDFTEEEVFNRERNTSGSDIQFSAEQHNTLTDVANRLIQGKKVAIRIPNGSASNFDATALQILREVYEQIPPSERSKISFMTGATNKVLLDFSHDMHNTTVHAFDPKLVITSQSEKIDGRKNIDITPVSAEQNAVTPRESIAETNRIFDSEGKDGAKMYSDGDTIADLVAKYGKKKQNTYAQQNNIVTPERTTDNNRVSNSVQTLKSVKTVSPEMRDMMDTRMLEEGMGVYNPVTLNKLRQYGQDYIAEKGGVTDAMRELTKDFKSAKWNNITKLISAANQVFTTIADENRTDIINSREYADFVSDYMMMRSEWGRIGKTMQLVNDSPLARQMYWEKVIQKINDTNRTAAENGLRGMLGKSNFTPIELPQYLKTQLATAKTTEEINAAEEAITKYIGENSPVTLAEYLRNWRYFSMLANPVTHARNMLGNLGMRALVMQKNLIATGMENAAVAMGLMEPEERTHAFRLRYSPETRNAGKQLWAEYGDSVQSGGHEGFQQKVGDSKRKSPIKFIDKLMRFSGNSLENEDRLFLYWTFTDSAQQYIAAKGLDPTNLTSQQKADIASYATQQAQEATYRDASKFADMLNTISRSSTGARLAVESVMPFKKTPINIAKRGVNYSPYGIAKGLVQLGQTAVRSKQGNPTIPASAIIDQLAQGLTGTGVLALGMLLSRLGVLKLSAGSGDKDETFMRDIGHQDYSLELGNWSIKIESLAPMTFPLFMGAALDEALREQGATTDDEMGILEAAASVADPLMEMSFMSSINNALETYSSSKLGGIAENMVQSYIGQIFPTIGAKANAGGWISNIVDPYRRTTKASQKMSESVIGTNGDYWLRSIVNKIPFAKMALEPYVKTTGEYDIKDTFGDYVLANLNSFALPTNIQRIDSSPINEEIARLVSVTGNTEFVPQNPQKKMTLPNKAKYNMTAKEYTEYSKEYNEAVYAALTEAISSTRYLNATEDVRIDMLEKAKKRAGDAVNKKYKVIFAERYAQGQGREE